ncbi:hypothetical protein D9M72_560400 [compost metagenome]
MLVHHAGRQYEGTIKGRTLAFVDGGGVAMIDIAIGTLGKGDIASVVEPDRKQRRLTSRLRRSNRPEHAVLHVLNSRILGMRRD